MACEEGDTKCEGPHLYVCVSYYDPITGEYTTQWELLQANAPECEVPEPECTPGAQRCIGPDLYECSREGQWELVEGDSPQCPVEPPPPDTFHLDILVPSWAAGGYVEPGSGNYEAYSTVRLTAHPLSGYQFTGWGRDASGTSLTYNLYMDSDKDVEAYFEPVPVPEYVGTIVEKELEYNGDRKAIPVY